jgi:hypothetical protein
MGPRDFAIILFAMSVYVVSSSQSLAQNSSTSRDSCVVRLAGISFNCPAGWKIVEEIDRSTTIGDFERTDRTGNLTVPPGRASLTVAPMPGVYKKFDDWLYAAGKVAPDAIRTTLTVSNKPLGLIKVVCFTSPESQRGLIYTSYFFETNGTSLNVEIHYLRSSPNASKYGEIPNLIMESLESYKR